LNVPFVVADVTARTVAAVATTVMKAYRGMITPIWIKSISQSSEKETARLADRESRTGEHDRLTRY
jgi:hypothetical protein